MDELTFRLPSRMFGREHEIAAVRSLLDEGARLVTITGPGGVGKTRVGFAAAPDDAVVVTLAGTRDDGLVAALLRAFGPEPVSGQDPMETVAAAANGRVVVLDTFEHLSSQASVIAELIKRAPRVQVIVTSRARLRLDAEKVVQIGRLEPRAAQDMFRDRVAAIGGAQGSAEDVSDLCEVLDRLPLAIELAAARTGLFTPRQLVTRLSEGEPEQALGVLGRGAADAPERQRSIRATIAWSCVLLDKQAAVLFRRLGVFPADFGLDAAEEVCAGNPLTADEVLDAMAALVDLHLVEPVTSTSDAPRFRLLDTLREYALDQLDEIGQLDETRDRLVEWAVSYALRAGKGLDTRREDSWLAAITADSASLHAALALLAEQGDARRGLVLASGIAMSWMYGGPIGEGRQWLDSLLTLDTSSVPESERAVAAAWRARFTVELGDLSVIDELERVRDLITETGEWLRATEHLVYALTMSGDLGRADELTREAMQVADARNQRYWSTAFLVRRAMTAWRVNEATAAVEYARKAAHVAQEMGYKRLLARAEQIITVYVSTGAPTYEALLANLRTHQASGDRRGVVSALASLSAISPPAEGARWLRDAMDEAARIGYRQGEVFSIYGLSYVAGENGWLRAAAQLEAGLQPYMAMVKANVDPIEFATWREVMARVRAKLGPDFDAISAGVPPGWAWLIERARAFATEIGAEAAPPEQSAARSTMSEAPRRRGRPRQSSLSDRELEVLAAIARGGTNLQISSELSISPKTVMHHSASVYRKLGVRGRAEAIAFAFRSGLLSPSPGPS